jgi:hypothetical protein
MEIVYSNLALRQVLLLQQIQDHPVHSLLALTFNTYVYKYIYLLRKMGNGSLFYDAFSVTRLFSVDYRVTVNEDDDEQKRTNIYGLSGIGTQGLMDEALLLRPRGHWDRQLSVK